MKVVHNPAHAFMRGQSQGYVFGPAPSRTFSLVRSYVYPKITEHNHDMGKIMMNLKLVWDDATPEYRGDGALYASRYYSENQELPDQKIPVNNSFGNFVRAMFAWQASDPTHVELETVTAADIISTDAEVRTWARAVEAGFLPLILLYTDLTESI